MAQSPADALRLYGVATIDPHSPDALAEGTVLVPFRALGAIVAPTSYSRVVLDDKEMSDYTRVLEEAQASSAVLPAPPGTVFRSQANLARWLELHYFTLTDALGLVEGNAEGRVTVLRAPGGEEHAENREEQRERNKRLQSIAAASLRVLRGQAQATVSLPVTDDDTTVVAQASFLVDAERWGVFADLVAKEDQRHTDLDFNLTGPWPPYDFVKMEFGS